MVFSYPREMMISGGTSQLLISETRLCRTPSILVVYTFIPQGSSPTRCLDCDAVLLTSLPPPNKRALITRHKNPFSLWRPRPLRLSHPKLINRLGLCPESGCTPVSSTSLKIKNRIFGSTLVNGKAMLKHSLHAFALMATSSRARSLITPMLFNHENQPFPALVVISSSVVHTIVGQIHALGAPPWRAGNNPPIRSPSVRVNPIGIPFHQGRTLPACSTGLTWATSSQTRLRAIIRPQFRFIIRRSAEDLSEVPGYRVLVPSTTKIRITLLDDFSTPIRLSRMPLINYTQLTIVRMEGSLYPSPLFFLLLLSKLKTDQAKEFFLHK
ncbi:uncharacterized protein BT62DRAFT_1078567 [Guyanagaster necrorhizus]|uniref:Uncharacterized protein n=1 Tax=Guyanagaster necrorhizus TaxID=856835 RepID=A0A9P7VMN2_9AGAR|nr:uncharacterized protein BT62DRAFT_1078567 [Guyanagaster necrorhizus MCA 3950]KAG7443529.1 hypothetical protein BT62DRAFT_1078567 [Guyanagaster necrorhizus MCA 3950]